MTESAAPPEVNSLLHQRSPWRGAAALVALVLIAMLASSLLRNDRYQWDVVWQYFFSRQVLSGLWMTIVLTATSMFLGTLLGIVLALMKLSDNRLLASTSHAYIWFFRGAPILVQLIFWFNLSALYPTVSLGVPFGPEFVTWNTNNLITPLTAAIIGLSLNEAAYMAEIVRAGILSVDEGQTEAAKCLGMSKATTFRRIVFPQAMRVILPPTGSQVITMLKTTALVSVIALSELLYSVTAIYSRTFQVVPLLIVASLWYLIVTTALTFILAVLETRYGRGASRYDSVRTPRIRLWLGQEPA